MARKCDCSLLTTGNGETDGGPCFCSFSSFLGPRNDENEQKQGPPSVSPFPVVSNEQSHLRAISVQNHCNRTTGAPSETRILYQKEGGDDHADDSCGGYNRFPFSDPIENCTAAESKHKPAHSHLSRPR